MTYWLYPKRTIIYVKKAMSNADADRPPVDVAIFVIDVSEYRASTDEKDDNGDMDA